MEISRERSRFARINNAKTSRRLRKLYKIRQRFKHAINAMVKTVVEYPVKANCSKIVIGDLNGIRINKNKGAKVNSMVHNFWSFSYIAWRLRGRAEEYNMEVEEVSEYDFERMPMVQFGEGD